MRDLGRRFGIALASVSLVLLAQASIAALPTHPVVHTFEPTAAEKVNPDGSPAFVFAGEAVAIRNDVAVVSLPGLDKLAIFKRTASGWSRSGSVSAPESTSEFGQVVAYRDDTIIAASDAGAYVFKLVNGVWKYKQKLLGQNAATRFQTLAYQDNLVLAGSPQFDQPGLVYAFELTSSGKLVRRVRLQPTDPHPNDGFGSDVAMSANTIVVGAPGNSGGTAYVFKKSSSRWSQSQKLSGQDSTNEEFGAAVAINNGVIVIGAPGEDSEWSSEDDGLHSAAGAAFVFLPNATGAYVQTQRLRPSSADVPNFMDFGRDIAMSGNRIAVLASELIGGSGDDAPGQVFSYSLTNNQAAAIGLATSGPRFTSLSLSNNWLLVGQPRVGGCGFYGCTGQATLYDVNRVQ
jgi:hypothetical protein